MNHDDKNSNSFKNIIQDFFDGIVNSYYKGCSKNSGGGSVSSGKTALLEWLKEAFNKIKEIDRQLESSLGKTTFKPVSIPVKIFVRVRIEEFFYAQLISNLLSNLLDNDNIQEYGYTRQQILLIQSQWLDLIKKTNSIINRQVKAKIDDIILTKNEYYEFALWVSKISSGLNKIVRDFEEYISLKECENYLKNQRVEYIRKNPIPNIKS